MDVTLEPARTENAEALLGYLEALVAEGLTTILPMPELPTLEQERAFLARYESRERSLLLVARHREGAIVGVLNVDDIPHPAMAHVGKLGMSVARDHRGRGIGTAMLEHVLGWARKAGLTRIELEAMAGNEGAIRLYERLGFEREGVRRQAVEVAGTAVDTVIMAVLLEETESRGGPP